MTQFGSTQACSREHAGPRFSRPRQRRVDAALKAGFVGTSKATLERLNAAPAPPINPGPPASGLCLSVAFGHVGKACIQSGTARIGRSNACVPAGARSQHRLVEPAAQETQRSRYTNSPQGSNQPSNLSASQTPRAVTSDLVQSGGEYV